jgi:HAD superfamily hydrolase (TIGR01459 family)
VERIEDLRALSGRYDALLCDVWGVIHDGRTLFPGVADALRGARADGISVVLLTNVPRPASTMPRALARLGFPPDAWDAVVTSGDAIRTELARRAPGPVHRIGRETDEGLWEGLGLRFADLDQARFLAIAGLRGADDSPQAYAAVLGAARQRDLELVCANPDIQVQVGARLQWSAGAVAAAYEALGGRVVQAGKPHPAIYEQAFEVLAGLVGPGLSRDRVLAIGDGIATDVLGANRQGLDSLFIATGMHGDSLLVGGSAGGDVDLDQVHRALGRAGVRATYVLPRLA